MAKPKTGTSQKGKVMHYSVGAVIEADGKYLLIDRAIFPPGFAGIAGHVDEGETDITALIREVEEESGLKVESHELLFEEELDWNECSKGVGTHHWRLYRCKVNGELRQNKRETHSIDWYTKEEIAELKLEPVWKYWFEKLKIIS